MDSEEKIVHSPDGAETHQKPAPIDPSKVSGNYVIMTESAGNQRRIFSVFNGTVKILPISSLAGAFELK